MAGLHNAGGLEAALVGHDGISDFATHHGLNVAEFTDEIVGAFLGEYAGHGILTGFLDEDGVALGACDCRSSGVFLQSPARALPSLSES